MISEIEERLNELDGLIYDLEKERFCDGCEYVSIAADVENFWGARCLREYPICPADFSPGDKDCPRRAEFFEKDDALEAARKEYEKLSAAYEAAVA